MQGPDGQELAVAPCQALCEWSATDDVLRGEQVFRCGGCGSEWVRSERWTPIDASGEVPAAVADVRAGRGAGGAGSGGS